MKIASVALGAVALAVALSRAHAALVSVTQDGDLLVEDSSSNLIWADLASPTNLTWSSTAAAGSAQAWVLSLDTMKNANGTIGYGGYTDWTLATGDGTYTRVNPGTDGCASLGIRSNGLGCGTSTSIYNNELDQLFVNELGNTAGKRITATGPFKNLDTGSGAGLGVYWSSSSYAPVTGWGWVFNTAYGEGYYSSPDTTHEALAVRADASASTGSSDGPLPLWASGALGAALVGIASRRLSARP